MKIRKNNENKKKIKNISIQLFLKFDLHMCTV